MTSTPVFMLSDHHSLSVVGDGAMKLLESLNNDHLNSWRCTWASLAQKIVTKPYQDLIMMQN